VPNFAAISPEDFKEDTQLRDILAKENKNTKDYQISY
jgi:hypothetical protein